MFVESRIDGEDVDFGTLVVALAKDDDLAITVYDGQPVITIPLYNHQAQELIDALQPIADLEDLA